MVPYMDWYGIYVANSTAVRLLGLHQDHRSELLSRPEVPDRRSVGLGHRVIPLGLPKEL